MDAGVTDPNTVFDGGSVDTGVKVEECLDDLFSLEKSWSGSVVFETLLTVCVCVCASVLATVLMFYVWYYLVCMSVVLSSVYEFVLTTRLEARCFKSWTLVHFFSYLCCLLLSLIHI